MLMISQSNRTNVQMNVWTKERQMAANVDGINVISDGFVFTSDFIPDFMAMQFISE